MLSIQFDMLEHIRVLSREMEITEFNLPQMLSGLKVKFSCEESYYMRQPATEGVS